MSQRLQHGLLIGLSCLAITACGGGDDDSGASVDDAKLRSLIKQSNYVTSGFPQLTIDNLWYGSPLQQQGVVRFDTTSKIPLYFVSQNGEEQVPVAISNAVSKIEARLGDVFDDMEVIHEDLSVYRDTTRPDENVYNDLYDETRFKNNHGIIGGLVINIGAGYYDKQYGNDPQTMCANASIAPYRGSMALVINESRHTYADTSLLWVNMGNGQCSWSSDTVVHEMAHAMGMFAHAEPYFGHWGTTAMDMLHTLYANDAGTAYGDLIPARQ